MSCISAGFGGQVPHDHKKKDFRQRTFENAETTYITIVQGRVAPLTKLRRDARVVEWTVSKTVVRVTVPRVRNRSEVRYERSAGSRGVVRHGCGDEQSLRAHLKELF
jgi:hypothetical protein